ncbi:Beta-barrel assembly-enhancing protease [Fundidesulfovibrio magnetotacticus]|uniref:Beta-barrel assembly-enhancing protease n=1 Tax=Fundidesulfovibrio magnetotacticus TaxID=2730080 RepID=A0A6V8LZS2_9BACT|nr:tetratricopeptide repeat protein [Fundidesulfovibrio magnetotacticus]GFK96041.1 Beta-barrel assembly-enhancing protease [Fundidesulfovibrio magnetotacticus]
MSAELTKARKQITQVNTYLKQGKPLPAVTALHDAVLTMLKAQLMKAERDEFCKLIEQAVYQLNNNKELRVLYPLVIPYAPGEEKALLERMRELLRELQTNTVEEAKDEIQGRQVRRAEGLKTGKEQLERKEIDPARKTLGSLVREFPHDAPLRAEVAELFMQAELYEDAFKYLDEALGLTPDQLHLYNRIGIVLRKLRQFDVAEKYFMRAVNFAKDDPNLYFNLGRLYIDWERFDKVERAARLALKLNPNFHEAAKMFQFALKKQGKPAC